MKKTYSLLYRCFWHFASRPRLGKNGEPAKERAIIDPGLKRLFEGSGGRMGQIFRVLAPLRDSHAHAKSFTPAPSDGFTARRMVGKRELMDFAFAGLSIGRQDARILELGCCDCANLFALRQLGFRNLTGVEINSSFLAAGRGYDPEAFSSIQVISDSIENFAQTCSQRYDILLSCAVLQHVNPISNHIFGNLSRLTNKYIITIEAEEQCNPMHYPRNFGRVFAGHGFRELFSQKITIRSFEGVSEDITGYTLRLLRSVVTTDG